MKNCAPTSSVQNQQLPKYRTTLIHPKWVKLGTLLLTTENKPKETFLLQQATANTQKKNSLARTRAQKKTNKIVPMHMLSRYLQIFSCLEIKRVFITSPFIVTAITRSKLNYVAI